MTDELPIDDQGDCPPWWSPNGEPTGDHPSVRRRLIESRQVAKLSKEAKAAWNRERMSRYGHVNNAGIIEKCPALLRSIRQSNPDA